MEEILIIERKSLQDLVSSIKDGRYEEQLTLIMPFYECTLEQYIRNHILDIQEINKIITPSKWVSKSYIKNLPIIETKITEWPAGVNTKFWCPNYKIV